MGLQVVFSSNLDPASPNLSVEFSDATAFLIEAPSINAEMEIDCYLQIYLTGINGELVRNIPLGKISESAILLNLADTETASAIPVEYLDSGLTMRLLFLASSTTFIYAYIIKPDCTLCQLANSIEVVDGKIDDLATRLASLESKIDGVTAGNNNTLSLLNLILSALSIALPVTPVTASASSSNQLQFLGII